LLEEKGSEKFTSKYNVAIFIELESAAIIESAADVELIFATFKVSNLLCFNHIWIFYIDRFKDADLHHLTRIFWFKTFDNNM
jgi:hypothetical protein